MSAEIERLRTQFQSFARVECRGRSPLYAEICRAVAGDDGVLALAARTPERQRRPSLLLAAIHFLLLGGVEHELAAHVPTVAGERIATGRAGASALSFCREHADPLGALLRTRSTLRVSLRACGRARRPRRRAGRL